MVSNHVELEFGRELTTISDNLISIAHSTIALAMQLKISPAQKQASEPPAVSALKTQTASGDNSYVLMTQTISETGRSEASSTIPKIEKPAALTRGDSTDRKSVV